jgi:hypothetical protein
MRGRIDYYNVFADMDLFQDNINIQYDNHDNVINYPPFTLIIIATSNTRHKPWALNLEWRQHAVKCISVHYK